MGGKSKTKTKTVNDPYKPALPSIDAGLGALNSGLATANSTFAQYRPAQDAAIQHIQDNIAHPPQYVTDARNQLDHTINGDFLNSNPEIDRMAQRIGDQTQGGFAATFGASGRNHGGLAALLSAQGVGDALSTFRGNQYNFERGLQQQSIAAAPMFHTDEYTDTSQLFPAINATANGPLGSAGLFGAGVSGLTGNFGTQTGTQTQSQGFGLAQYIALASQVAQAAAAASDPRLKTNVVYVSTDPDGLDWFDFDYRQDMGIELPKERQRGVMATDVEYLRPWALGPTINGTYMTVNYARLAMHPVSA